MPIQTKPSTPIMRVNMTIKKRMIFLAITAVVIIVGSIIAQLMSGSVNKEGNGTHGTRYLSYIIADEFRQTSMDLTRLCRTYVSTGEQKHWNAYWDIVNWRAGKQPRPSYVNKDLYRGKVKKQSDIMKELGFSKTEFALLQEASNNSNALIATEDQAMKTIKEGKIVDGPMKPKPDETPQQFALRIVFDDAYHGEVVKIMTPVNRFFEAIDIRTEKSVTSSASNSSFWLTTSFVFQVIIALLFAGFVWSIWSILKQLGGEPDVIAGIAKNITSGQFEIEQTDKKVSGIFAEFIKMANSLKASVKSIQETMNGISQGDFTKSMSDEGMKGELALIKDSINRSITMLSRTIDQAIVVSEQVSLGSGQLSSSSQALSSGTTEQAASLEEISSSVSEVGSQANTNNENASQAAQLSSQTLEIVTRGNSQMQEMLSSMDNINNSSTDISKIIKVIDEIAFQTNLLALNAAVEAARAGKYGKGFAVVAEEVRNLAARSAEAAKNTTELIENSAREVELGVDNASKTAEILAEISESITKVNDLADEIASASRNQSDSIDEISNSLNQVNDVVQQNSSISEETASASEELNGQAMQLKNLMQEFKLDRVTHKNEFGNAKTANLLQTPRSNVSQLPDPPSVTKPQAKMITLDDDEFGKY